jgi:hypothetical protein
MQRSFLMAMVFTFSPLWSILVGRTATVGQAATAKGISQSRSVPFMVDHRRFSVDAHKADIRAVHGAAHVGYSRPAQHEVSREDAWF